MENKIKRKRTHNFTAEEKLRFVRLMSKEGQSIISKVKAHDTASNKDKERAWIKITRIHNYAGGGMRTTETLKKLWTKLKGEAKNYKAASKHSESGSGEQFADPVLELVVDLTGRASTDIHNINDCDAVGDEDAMAENDYLDDTSASIEYESIFLEDFPEDQITSINVSPKDQLEVKKEGPESVADLIAKLKKSSHENTNKRKGWASRRPEVNVSKEKTDKLKKQQLIRKRFAAERLRAEQEKTNLVIQQMKQNAELHRLKMENERLKKELLQTLLKRVLDGDTKDGIKMATHCLFQSE